MLQRSRLTLLGSMLTRPVALPFAALVLGLTGCPADETSDTGASGDSTTSDDDDDDDTDDSVTLTSPDPDSTTDDPTTTDPTDATTTDPTDATTTDPTDATTTDPTDATTTDPTDATTTDPTDATTTDPTDATTTTDGTTGGAVCGDNVAEGDEVCDGDDLAGEDCVSQGFGGGSLACLDDCSGFNTDACGDVMNDCAEQIVGDFGSPVSMGDLGMEDNDIDASCGGMGGNDLVVEFTAPSDGLFFFDTFGSDFDTKLALFDNCDAGSELACNDDFGNLQSQVQLDMTAGQVVLVVVDGFDGDVGNFLLNINPEPVCGDGQIGVGEVCDGDEVGGLDCSALGLGANDLVCLDDCLGLDTSTCDAPAGYGNCTLAPEADVCTIDEVCVGDGVGSNVCADLSCNDASECAAAPASGNATVTCADLTGDMVGDCYLSCEMGETCPDGMVCLFDQVCAWPPA